MSIVWLSAPVLRLTTTDALGLEDDRLRRGLGLPVVLPVAGTMDLSLRFDGEIVILPERERLRPWRSLSEFLSWGGRFLTKLAVLTACCISLSTN